jgi:hypothetical protein
MKDKEIFYYVNAFVIFHDKIQIQGIGRFAGLAI